jgi:hypothetical protein
MNCTTSTTKVGPLFDLKDKGILNQGMISFNRHLATSPAFSVQMGKAFIHPETVQTNASKYLHIGPCQGLFLAHLTTSFTYYLTYAGELEDIKVLGQGGLKNCPP